MPWRSKKMNQLCDLPDQPNLFPLLCCRCFRGPSAVVLQGFELFFFLLFLPQNISYDLLITDLLFFSVYPSLCCIILYLPCPMRSIFSCKLIIKWLEKKTFAGFAFYPIIILLAMPDFIRLKEDFKIFDSNAKSFFCVKIQVATSYQYQYMHVNKSQWWIIMKAY